MATTHSLETIRSAFDAFFPGAPVLRVAQNLGGHINQTYFVETTRRKDGCRLFVLQCLNKHVFPDVLGLMDNVMRISEHLEKKSLADPAADRKRDHLHYLHTADGRLGVDAAAGFWRLYRFIPHAEGRLQAESPAEARAAAAAFGRFQALLADMPPPRLVETIPAFHDTRRRYEALECAFIENRAGRADEPEARELLDGRAGQEALRELAILLDVASCPFPLCVLRGYADPAELDEMSDNYCPPCFERVRHAMLTRGGHILAIPD